MTATEGYAAVEGGHLYYERAGEGFPVVLIHPSPWDLRIWEPQFGEFSQHHDVVRYDLRGYGRSDVPAGPYSDVRDLRTLLDDLAISRCALVGCSRGAQLALDLAIAYPDIADAIVAVSPSLSGYEWKDEGLDALVAEVDRAVEMGDLAAAMDIELAVWAPMGSDPASDELVRSVAMDNAHVLRPDGRWSETPPSALPYLPDIKAATLIVVGDADIGEIHDIADALAGAIPGASKRVIADADHLVHVRKPEKFNRLVLDFLTFRM